MLHLFAYVLIDLCIYLIIHLSIYLFLYFFILFACLYIYSFITYYSFFHFSSSGLMMVPALLETSITDGEMLFADLIIYPISPTHAQPHTYPMLDSDPEIYDVRQGTYLILWFYFLFCFYFLFLLRFYFSSLLLSFSIFIFVFIFIFYVW